MISISRITAAGRMSEPVRQNRWQTARRKPLLITALPWPTATSSAPDTRRLQLQVGIGLRARGSA